MRVYKLLDHVRNCLSGVHESVLDSYLCVRRTHLQVDNQFHEGIEEEEKEGYVRETDLTL